MNHLDDFIIWLNEEVGGEGPLPLSSLPDGSFGEAMQKSINRHYAEDRQRAGVRMSNLGKPAIILALAKLGYVEPEPKGKMRWNFITGDFFENWLEVMMRTYGIEVLDSQITYELMGITGHADYLVVSPVTGQPTLVEAKTMSENYSRMFKKDQTDDRGYVTQLALYMEASGYPGTWVCLNKGNSEVFEVVPEPDKSSAALVRGKRVLDGLAAINSIEDIFEYMRVPPPQAERFKNAETGRYILPQSIAWSPLRHALYKLSLEMNGYNQPREYVVGYADAEYMRNALNQLVESGAITYDEEYAN